MCVSTQTGGGGGGAAFIPMCHILPVAAISSVILDSFMCSLIVSSHLYLGRHVLLFPCTCIVSIFLVVSPPSFLNTWPCHRSRFCPREVIKYITITEYPNIIAYVCVSATHSLFVLQLLFRHLLFIDFSAVTFRQFVANLLSTLSTMTDLTHIRQDLLDLTRRYDDCMRTCEIPFTKRSQREKSTLHLLHRLYSRYDVGMCAPSVFQVVTEIVYELSHSFV